MFGYALHLPARDGRDAGPIRGQDRSDCGACLALVLAVPRLSRLTYDAKLNGASPTQAGAALIAKYGRPMQGEAGVGYIAWKNSARSYDPTTPALTGSISDDGLSLTLQQSTNSRLEAYRRMEARASELAAGRGGGVRF